MISQSKRPLRDGQRKRRLSVLTIEQVYLSVTPTVESVLDDCQAGFRAGRRSEEQVTNLRILSEKKHRTRLLNFVDYRKAFYGQC